MLEEASSGPGRSELRLTEGHGRRRFAVNSVCRNPQFKGISVIQRIYPIADAQYRYQSYWCSNPSPLTISVNAKYAAILPSKQVSRRRS